LKIYGNSEVELLPVPGASDGMIKTVNICYEIIPGSPREVREKKIHGNFHPVTKYQNFDSCLVQNEETAFSNG
jgi:hypothetical protein